MADQRVEQMTGGEIATVTKIMSATPAEYARGIARLTADTDVDRSTGSTDITLEEGTVRITYQQREGRRLSPLFVVPQAEVVFAFRDVPEAARTAFIARFDKVFQRGGG